MRPPSADPSTDPSATPPDDLSTVDLSGRCIGSSYLLIEPIGGGGTGTVWRALDRSTGAQVAVKLLREELMSKPRAVTRFVQERAILLMLRHDNIVRVRDLLTAGESLGLVMDLVPGGSLRDHLRRHQTLPPAAAAAILAQVAAALDAAHGLGVVHRDLKPDNILLQRDGDDPAIAPDVRLTDFGIARVLDTAGLTTPGALVGTPNYIAPEVVNGAAPTPAVDVYALGILLYEMVTGRPPYAGASAVTVLRRHLECTPHRYPGLPDEVWRVVLACMDKDPARRPSAADLAVTARSLARSTAGVPALPPPDAPVFGPTSTSGPLTPPKRRGRHRLLALCLAAVCAGLAAGVSGMPDWLLSDRDSPPTAAAPPAAGTPGSGPTSTRPATATPSAGPSGRAPGLPVRVPTPTVDTTVRVSGRLFGPLECPDEYVWDPGHPARAKPCHATGPAIRLVGRMQAVPGVQADVSLSLQDATTGRTVAGPFVCRGLMFTDFAPEHLCGPFDTTAAEHGRRYVVVQSWRYTGRSIFPGGTARSDPFRW